MRKCWNPLVFRSLLGTCAAGLLGFGLFHQSWIPLEISTPETGVLVAMPANAHPPVEFSPSSVSETHPVSKQEEPLEVPLAKSTEQSPASNPSAVPFVQTASLTPKKIPAVPKVPVPTYAEPRKLGKPSVAYQLPQPFQIPTSKTGIQWNFVIPTGIEVELFLTGAELHPGNKALVKRMILSFDPTGTARQKDRQTAEAGFASPEPRMPIPSIVLAEWATGMTARSLPKGTAYRIPAGADLILTVDYAATAVPAADPWSMGLHLTRSAPKHLLGRIEVEIAEPQPLQSPAERSRQSASYQLPTDVTLYSVRPEFLQGGGRLRVYATTPSGKTLPLLEIENWEPHRQERHNFQEPISLPKEARIFVQTWTDDSAKRFSGPAGFRCELQVATPNPAHLEPLMRHNQAAGLQP